MSRIVKVFLERKLACKASTARLDPNDVLAYCNKGFVLSALKRYDEADKAFAKAKQLGYTG